MLTYIVDYTKLLMQLQKFESEQNKYRISVTWISIEHNSFIKNYKEKKGKKFCEIIYQLLL